MTQSDGRPSAEALAKNHFPIFNRNQASLDTDRNIVDKRKQQMFNVPVPSLQLQNVQRKMAASIDTQTNRKAADGTYDMGTLSNRAPLENPHTTYLKKISIEFDS